MCRQSIESREGCVASGKTLTHERLLLRVDPRFRLCQKSTFEATAFKRLTCLHWGRKCLTLANRISEKSKSRNQGFESLYRHACITRPVFFIISYWIFHIGYFLSLYGRGAHMRREMLFCSCQSRIETWKHSDKNVLPILIPNENLNSPV